MYFVAIICVLVFHNSVKIKFVNQLGCQSGSSLLSFRLTISIEWHFLAYIQGLPLPPPFIRSWIKLLNLNVEKSNIQDVFYLCVGGLDRPTLSWFFANGGRIQSVIRRYPAALPITFAPLRSTIESVWILQLPATIQCKQQEITDVWNNWMATQSQLPFCSRGNGVKWGEVGEFGSRSPIFQSCQCGPGSSWPCLV